MAALILILMMTTHEYELCMTQAKENNRDLTTIRPMTSYLRMLSVFARTSTSIVLSLISYQPLFHQELIISKYTRAIVIICLVFGLCHILFIHAT